MADVLQQVKDMAAALEQGQRPALLVQLLAETFAQPARGWFARWRSNPRTYEPRWITLFEDGGFFRRSCVFWVHVRDRFLEGVVLPSGGTFGLFALGPRGLSYLNRRQDHVEAVLRGEARGLDACAPGVLASLVVEALGREGNRSHEVLEAPAYLARYEDERYPQGGGYQINTREWERVRSRVAAPALSGDPAGGWQLAFCSVFGWMHEKQDLIRHRYRFAPDLRITHEEEVLSRKIFRRTPGLRY